VKERWVAARRAEGRRRLRWIVALAVVTGLVAAAWGISQSPLLDVDHLVVSGTGHTTAGHTTAAQVEAAAGIHRGDALAWLNTGRAVAGLEALPYVRTARVERQWPDTVRIVVAERTPVAWVEGGGRRALVDGTGRVLELVTEPPAGLPQLAGTKAVPDPGGTVATAVAARVAAGLLGLSFGVQSITATDAGVSLWLPAGGPEIRMGEPDRVRVKVRAASAVLGAMFLAGSTVHYVDVSVPTNPVAG
jgi:cell division protein FtsQ